MNYADIKEAMPEVERYCYYRFGGIYNADIRHDLIVIALEKEFIEKGWKISSWLIEVAKNLCMCASSYYHYRSMKAEDTIEDGFCFQECNIDVERINRVVEELPKYLRVPLRLSIQGYPVREIASIQKLKPTSVKSRIWEARNKLKPKLINI